MWTVVALLSLCAFLSASKVKTLGNPNFACDPKSMAPSASIPTNVNQVRFADIKVIGALGDSLSAANGAGTPANDPLGLILQYRGLCFQAGGQYDLSEQITVPNILKKFNSKLFGYAVGTGSENVWEIARLNIGIPGATTYGLPDQATSMVERIKAHPEIDLKNDWKLVNIFIGGNDICGYCNDIVHNSTARHSPQHFRDNLIQTVQILKDNLPRTIVSLTGMFNMGMLRTVDNDQFFCDTLHVFECHCESDKGFTNDDISNACISYMKAEQEIQDSGRFEADDFTFVIQPFFEDVTLPPLKPDGTVDLSFFAPDCFHFSQYGHSLVARHLWNNIVQPVGQKTRKVNLSDNSNSLSCPSTSCPFFPTVKNSKECAQWMTPSLFDLRMVNSSLLVAHAKQYKMARDTCAEYHKQLFTLHPEVAQYYDAEDLDPDSIPRSQKFQMQGAQELQLFFRLPATIENEKQWKFALAGLRENFSDVGFPLSEFNKTCDAFLAAMAKNGGGVTAEQKKNWEEVFKKAYDDMKASGWF